MKLFSAAVVLAGHAVNPGSPGAHCVGVEHTEIRLPLPPASWDVGDKGLYQHTLLKFTVF